MARSQSVGSHSREPVPELIALQALSQRLSIDPRTVKSWSASGKMPAPIRMGNRSLWRWKVDEINSWLAKREAK